LASIGNVARSAGLRSIHSYRTARFSAAEMIAFTFTIDAGDNGVHR